MKEKQRILVVDDDENIAELIGLYLNKECFETKLVYDGEQALKAVKDFAPNLVLLDIMLPGIDGYEVLREIRRGGSLPVIMLSAKGETFDRVLGLELGADDYIMKPFDSKKWLHASKPCFGEAPKRQSAKVLRHRHRKCHSRNWRSLLFRIFRSTCPIIRSTIKTK